MRDRIPMSIKTKERASRIHIVSLVKEKSSTQLLPEDIATLRMQL